MCRDHGKALWMIWSFTLHTKCNWEGNSDKEWTNEYLFFTKNLMKLITEWYQKIKDEINDYEIDEEIRNLREILLSIEAKVW